MPPKGSKKKSKDLNIEMVFEKTRDLYNFAKLLRLIDNVTEFKCGKSGMMVSLMAPDSVTYAELTLPKNYFQKYNIQSPSNIGISLSCLISMLDSSIKDDPITILSYYDSDTITMIFSEKGNGY